MHHPGGNPARFAAKFSRQRPQHLAPNLRSGRFGDRSPLNLHVPQSKPPHSDVCYGSTAGGSNAVAVSRDPSPVPTVASWDISRQTHRPQPEEAP